MAKTYVIAEASNSKLVPGYLNAIAAAKSLTQQQLSVIVIGAVAPPELVIISRCPDVNNIFILANNEGCYFAEQIVPAIVDVLDVDLHSIVMLVSTFSKNLLPRIAGLLQCEMVSNVEAINTPNEVVQPMYAGDIKATIAIKSWPCLFTIRASSFASPKLSVHECASITTIAMPAVEQGLSLLNTSTVHHTAVTLANAKIIVAGGRALGSRENFQKLSAFAAKIGAAIGATRAAVDAGFAPNSYQIGQTGQIVAPEVYIAFGISGSAQHVAGITNSKVIIAVNTDADANIFQVADYGLVMDLFEAMPKILTVLTEQNLL